MNRRSFVKSAAAFAPLVGVKPSLAVQTVTDPLTAKGAEPAAGNPTPEAGNPRYEATLRRVVAGDAPVYSEEFLLADLRATPGRRFTEYSGDVSGRYIGALATAARVHGTRFPALDALVQKAIALQKPDGYFGSGFHYEKPTDLDLALLWGNGRLLVGLLEYFQLKPKPEVLAACVRLGNFLVRIGPLMLSKEIRDAFGAQHFASSYICWTQQVEGLANLYRITGDARYRKLAEEIVAVTERRPGDHVHGYLTSLRGWMDLYSATSDAGLLARCESAWADVAGSQDLLITGGVPEGWSPNNHRTEGCAEADWFRLSLGLWRATGRPVYLRLAERTAFNDLAFNQYVTGDFGHRVYTETGLPAAGAVRAWWCCTLHGLRCFPDMQSGAFRQVGDGLSYDLPVDGFATTESVSVSATSSLAVDGTIGIVVAPAANSDNKVPWTLRIRKPEWADRLTIRINGQRIEPAMEGGYAQIHRVWQAGDAVSVHYAMALRSEASGKDRVSYFYGPWLLGAPAAENVRYFNEQTQWNRLAGILPGTAERSTVGSGFSVPIAATKFSYIPSEFPEQPGEVVLRAIAEQAGQATTSWEIRFLTTDSPSVRPGESQS